MIMAALCYLRNDAAVHGKSRLGKSVLTFAPSPKELGEGLDNSRELKRP